MHKEVPNIEVYLFSSDMTERFHFCSFLSVFCIIIVKLEKHRETDTRQVSLE